MDFTTAFAIVVLSALGAALGAFVKEYFSSRGRKEGEIDAIATNLEEVLRQLRETTRATEEVRAAISGGLWVDQEKWKLKRDAYLTLLNSLNAAAGVFVEVRLLGGTPSQRATTFTALLRQRELRDPNAADSVQRAQLVARLIMVPESFAAIEGLTRDVAALMSASTAGNSSSGDDLDRLFAAHKRAFDILVEAARRDLDLAPVPNGA